MIAPARRDAAGQEESLDTRRAGDAIAPRPTRRPSGQRTMPGPPVARSVRGSLGGVAGCPDAG